MTMIRTIITLLFLFSISFAKAQYALQIKYSDGAPHLNVLDDLYLFISDDLSEFLNPVESRKIVTPQGFEAEISRNYYSVFISDESYTVIKTLEDGTLLYATYDPEPLVWRLTNETKEILGYPCQKAILSRDSAKKMGTDPQMGDIIAWFTTAIESQLGPKLYAGLPGLILEITYTEWTGHRTVATEIKKVEREVRLPDDLGYRVSENDIWSNKWSRRDIKKLKESSKDN